VSSLYPRWAGSLSTTKGGDQQHKLETTPNYAIIHVQHVYYIWDVEEALGEQDVAQLEGMAGYLVPWGVY